MQPVSDKSTRQQISKQAQEALDRHQPRKYRIRVDEDAIMQDEEWYHVLVVTENDVRDPEFYHALAEAEADLQDDDGHKYLLVPVIAD